MMSHRDKITIQKIISEMSVGIELLGNTDLQAFLENELLKRALGMTAINIGELVKVVTDDTRSQYNDFPWKAVAGMRDMLFSGPIISQRLYSPPFSFSFGRMPSFSLTSASE